MIRNKDHRTAGIRLLCTSALLSAVIFCSGGNARAMEAQVNVKVPVTQTFTTKQAQQVSVNKKSNYKLTALEADAPMPEENIDGGANENASVGVDGTYTFSMEGNAQTELSMTYHHGGVWKYRVVQTTPDAEYYTYDRTEYILSVYVENQPDGALSAQVFAENGQGEKCESIHFSNGYTGKAGAPDDKPGDNPSDKPEDKPDNKPGDKPGAKLDVKNPAKKASTAKTGDSETLALWMAVLILSFAGMALTTEARKKSDK